MCGRLYGVKIKLVNGIGYGIMQLAAALKTHSLLIDGAETSYSSCAEPDNFVLVVKGCTWCGVFNQKVYNVPLHVEYLN